MVPRDTILHGDALAMLRTLPDASVQTCVTSPPYWGLRDYGTARWDGGDPACDHLAGPLASSKSTVQGYSPTSKLATFGMPFKGDCGKCGARRIDDQLGLEPTPDEFVARLVGIFREVRRVLRDDGTLWLNLGDSYANDEKWGGATGGKHARALHGEPVGRGKRNTGLKPKDLVGIPWRVAFALQADGWYLRADCIWHKPNPMPESVRDRPTKAHEYLFLLAKSERYYYDADAIAEQSVDRESLTGRRQRHDDKAYRSDSEMFRVRSGFSQIPLGKRYVTRNKRSVWTIATRPYSGAHFATFPPALVEPCVLAGTPPQMCEHCGAPWRRVVERAFEPMTDRRPEKLAKNSGAKGLDVSSHWGHTPRGYTRAETTDWQPSCRCEHNTGSGRAVVLDPFMGAGTVACVARQHSRHYLGVELNAEYIALAQDRIEATIQPVLWTAPTPTPTVTTTQEKAS